MLKTRVITSLVGIAILLAVLFFFNTIAFDMIVAVVCLMAMHEIYSAFHFEKAQYLYAVFVPYVFLVMLSNAFAIQWLILPMSYLLLLCLALCVIAHVQSLQFANVAGMALFSAVVILCFYSIIHLKYAFTANGDSDEALYFICIILGTAWGGDTSAYFAGSAFGKHKLAPVVSPKKTIEGAIGGVCGSMVLGIVITLVYRSMQGISLAAIPVRSLLFIAVLCAVGSVLGILGDLFASVVKRQSNIKDYGTLFPGHGGILDRFDSVMFIAPFVSMAAIAMIN